MGTAMLRSGELDRIRSLSSRVRALKEGDYSGLTWKEAMTQVARESSQSEGEYHRTLALFAYFVNEEIQLCSLEVFLEGLDGAVRNLRERDRDFALTSEQRQLLREQIDAYLLRVGQPTNQVSALDYCQVQKDHVFTATTLAQLFGSLHNLGLTLERWFPNAYPEVFLLNARARLLLRFARFATAPTTLDEASIASSEDFTPLRDVLHRYVSIDVFAKQRSGRKNAYTFLSPKVDTNLLRKEWTWLWTHTGERLSLWLYEQ